jgi:hypothetical protein
MRGWPLCKILGSKGIWKSMGHVIYCANGFHAVMIACAKATALREELIKISDMVP